MDAGAAFLSKVPKDHVIALYDAPSDMMYWAASARSEKRGQVGNEWRAFDSPVQLGTVIPVESVRGA